jgi:SAM-dependent methyltransferase
MQPYKICGPVKESEAPETLGQWLMGESVAESIALCEYETTYPLFFKYLPREGRILESGCGTGRWVFYLRQRGFNVTGIDLARAALEIAKAYDPSAPVLLDDVLHSQFPDRSFDAAISLGVVEHFEEGPQRALAELRRILKDDGILLISVPVHNPARRFLFPPLRKMYHWFVRRRETWSSMTFWEYRYTQKEFRSYLEGAGFEILEAAPQDFRPPKNLGLYTDFRILQSRHKKWELNAFGKLISAVFRSVSPWAACSGVLWVCRKGPC